MRSSGCAEPDGWLVEGTDRSGMDNDLVVTTLKDVAREAGVSYQTVWRALHGKSDISAATLEHVTEVARRLGYRRNAVAGGLRTQRTASIGLVVLDVGNAYTGRLTRAIQVRASELGHSLMLINSGDDVGQERDAIITLLERRVDGLILNAAAGAEPGYLDGLLPDGFPLVGVNRAVPGEQAPVVESRNSDITAAVDHLASHGHERLLGVFGETTNPAFLARRKAFRGRVEQLGLSTRDDWSMAVSNDARAARAAVASVLRATDRPSGLVAAGNRLTEGALLALRDLGLRRGRDVELVGFDVDYAELLDPPLPALRQAAEQLGRQAVEVLLNLVSGDGTAGQRITPVPIELVIPSARLAAGSHRPVKRG